MRYVTHQFSHVETLERARRWLVQAGIDPSRIEAHTHGIPRISVAVDGAEAAEVHFVIDVAESSDPDGSPGIWDLARQYHIQRQGVEQCTASIQPRCHLQESFVVGWHPQDAELEITQIDWDRSPASEGLPGREGLISFAFAGLTPRLSAYLQAGVNKLRPADRPDSA